MADFHARYFSQALTRSVSFYVYLPLDADRNANPEQFARPPKTVLLLHGYTGDAASWKLDTPIYSLAAKYNLALIMPVSLMVRMEKPVTMGLTPAIAMAAYTTWKITLAIVNLRRSGAHPLLIRQLRTINLIDALVAILTLQNTLIMVNSSAGEETGVMTLAAVSSGLIYLVILTLTIRLFCKGKAKPTGR